MKRKNSLFVANRLKTVLSFMVVNAVLLAVNQFSVVELYGTVETSFASWSSYTNFHNKKIKSDVIYVMKEEHEEQTKSISYDYRLSKAKGGEYIAIGQSESIPIKYNSVFYLDEQCGLIFSNLVEMTTRNVALRCLY
ncbi:hypothetical protein [Vibrio rhodolitus]|uniref:hypothetical protein n=1 Tax=Vibrio rhodolitus TaxID=2231649 RepID=UPI000F4E8EF6|nr:hypothetical protein [Vibrio rhodolitus]